MFDLSNFIVLGLTSVSYFPRNSVSSHHAVPFLTYICVGWGLWLEAFMQ